MKKEKSQSKDKKKNQKKRTDKTDLKERKKGAPKWKRVIDEIEKI
jgi:hypothetical protein